jgi:GMP synthase-like glutamine amidotransferase
MRVGILAAGDTPRRLADDFGHYPAMFEGLLDGHGFDWRVFDVPRGDSPERPDACDAYLVTGAAAGVHDPVPWIGDLLGFLRATRGKAKLVGVCFGHQAIAQAFGGQVIKSPKGWGVGLHTYAVGARQGWMDNAPAFSLSASHQDQVVELPPGATVVAGSDFCPNGMLAYGDEAISLQLHPEFAPDYSIALIAGRRGDRIPEDLAARAIDSLRKPDDHEQVAGWIAGFLTQ